MAKKKNTEDKSLKREDIYGALAKEHPERDYTTSQPNIMLSDTIPESQPEGTYRFALNSVNNDRNELGRIQNEESNDVCFEFEDYEPEGIHHIVVRDCCGNQTLHTYSNEEELETIIEGLTQTDCGEYIHEENVWDILNLATNVGKEDIFDLIKDNLTDYVLIASREKCRNKKHTITFHGCCKDIYVKTVEEPYELCSQEVIDYFRETKCGQIGSYYDIGRLGDEHTIAVVYGGNSQMEEVGTELYSDCTGDSCCILIEMDTDVHIECHEVFPDTIINNIFEKDNYEYQSGEYTETLNSETGPCGETIYSLQNPILTDTCTYFAFELTDNNHFSNFMTIRFNGIEIPRKDDYDDSISQYWYLDGNIIVIKVCIKGNNQNQFEFSIPGYTDAVRLFDVTSLKEIELLDTDGNSIGSFIPTSLIVQAYIQNVTIDGIASNGIINRTYQGQTIDYYIIKNNNGEDVKIAFDNYYINLKYNNKIYCHLS